MQADQAVAQSQQDCLGSCLLRALTGAARRGVLADDGIELIQCQQRRPPQAHQPAQAGHDVLGVTALAEESARTPVLILELQAEEPAVAEVRNLEITRI